MSQKQIQKEIRKYQKGMDMEYLEIHSEIFDDIVEDIKQRNLSRNNMPKLIVGTGLFMIYRVPGMKKLAEHLATKIALSSDEYLKKIPVFASC